MHPPQPPRKRQAWTGRTLGGAQLFRICASLLPYVRAQGAWIISFGIAGGFLLCGGRHQFGMADYWRRLHPRASAPLVLLRCWRQFASFGRILCDRLLVFLRPQDFEVSYGPGGEALRAELRRQRGCILLSAHIGNWELSGFWLKNLISKSHPVFLVMVRDDLPHVQAFVDERMRGPHITVIDPRDGLSASLTIARALEDGHPVCMLGDRVFGGQASKPIDFMGGQARFPLGPFQTAAITGVPIYTCFLVKTSLRGYHLEVDPPWILPSAPRGRRRDAVIERAMLRWSRRLELQVRRFPFQWHNFFPFWLGHERRLMDGTPRDSSGPNHDR